MTKPIRKNAGRLSVVGLSVFLLGACSEQKSQEQNDHVWKQQVQTLERAQGVEKTLSDSALERDKKIEGEEAGTSGDR